MSLAFPACVSRIFRFQQQNCYWGQFRRLWQAFATRLFHCIKLLWLVPVPDKFHKAVRPYSDVRSRTDNLTHIMGKKQNGRLHRALAPWDAKHRGVYTNSSSLLHSRPTYLHPGLQGLISNQLNRTRPIRTESDCASPSTAVSECASRSLYSHKVDDAARFISSCLFSPFRLVQSISWFSLVFGRFGSPLGTNALICCKRYNWPFDEFILNLVKLGNNLFRDWYLNRVSDIEFNNAASLLEILFIREGHFKFSNNFTLNKSEINDIIKAIATAWSIPYSCTCFSFCLIVVFELRFFESNVRLNIIIIMIHIPWQV